MVTGTFSVSVDFRTINYTAERAAADWTLAQTTGPFNYGGVAYDSRLVLHDNDTTPDTRVIYFGDGLTFAGSTLTGGTIRGVQWMAVDTSATITLFLSGLSLSAVALEAVIATASTLDDRALLRQIFASHDNLVLSNGGDYVFVNTGNDTINARGGNDFVFAERGADLVYGGDGNDKLSGGADNDRLFGGTGIDLLLGEGGNDILYGGSGNDTINGGAGNDFANGGSGADIFDFRAGDGIDRIVGFEDGIDRIRFAISGSTAPINVQDRGADTRVTIEGVNIVLVNFDHARLSLADFLFLPV